ncbi:hypothetical protein Q7P37_005228 [Cladosporium fusiforme]
MATHSGPPDVSSAQPSSLDTANDSDWEYEYDDNETEEIYFTLDLTTHVPNAIQEKTYAKNGRLIRPEKTTAATGDNAPAEAVEAHGQDAAGEGDEEANAHGECGKLQILDLHTEKPYVKFNNGFYSCHWFTDLGTQFWITNPGVVSNPKLGGHVLDVVGSSQTRLVARPANLKRKRGSEDHGFVVSNEAAAQSVEVEEDGASDVSDMEDRFYPFDVDQDPNEPMSIPRQKIKDPHLAAQANFMERLSAVKLKKGEKDAHQIPMRVPVYYKGAANADELRAVHGSNNEDSRKTSAPPPEDSLASPAVRTPGPPGGEASPSQAQAGATNSQDPDAPIIIPRYTRRPRGGPRGGVPSNAARRSNLGLELMSETPPPRKRGRVSNAEKARRAAEAEAEAEAQSQSQIRGFALDPILGGGGASTSTPHQASESAPQTAPASQPQDPSTTPSQVSQPFKPRKRRRTKAQMEEARRLDAERRASLEASDSALRHTPDTTEPGRRSLRRTPGRRNILREAQEANAAAAQQAVLMPGQVGREIRFRLDGAVGSGQEASGRVDGRGGEEGGEEDEPEE